MQDPYGTALGLDPGFPFRIDQEPIRGAIPFYRILRLTEGRIKVLSVSAEADALVFMQPAEPRRTGRIIEMEPGSRIESIVMGRHVLDQVLLPCFRNKGLQDSIETRFRAPVTAVELASEVSKRVASIFGGLASETADGRSAWESAAVAELIRLFVVLYRAEGREDGPAAAYWQVNGIVSHIQAHYAEEFSLAREAGKYGLSPGYLSALFREKMGVPMLEYLNTVRIQKACMLLKRSSEPIIEIAYAVGYNNISFFNRYFRRIMKMSPREFRLSMLR